MNVMLCDVYLNDIIMPIMQKNTNQIELDDPARQRVSTSRNPRRMDNSQSTTDFEKIIHDIRGSIHVINIYTEILLDEVNGKINAEQRQALQDILKSTNLLNDLTNNLSQRTDVESKKE